MRTISRSYRELARLDTFEDRFEYLSLSGQVGDPTFGIERYLNQAFYASRQWKQARRDAIARDMGRDLGVEGFEIYLSPLVHHINPMSVEDIESGNPLILDLNNLITTTKNTHNAIHFGDASLLPKAPVERRPGDTKMW